VNASYTLKIGMRGVFEAVMGEKKKNSLKFLREAIANTLKNNHARGDKGMTQKKISKNSGGAMNDPGLHACT